ncbi:hypothetical protein CYMTET_52519 [Cymbomonas tetramitiformis]|uniref:Uncharacterized protein n=1 Tax=Cymbomonas tetramitiformis TaxID=36881 RepID=A0AAE0BKJ7_9CHLO|nr:hypothetical protein CYMTET_52519 [Cymbomonas tetramitiformis]
MSTGRQHARMAAVHSALASLRLRHQQHFTVRCGLGVSGGAHAPDTKVESITPIVDMSFDHYELTPQHPPLFFPPCVPLGHCLVVFGGVASLIPPLLLSALAEWSHTAFSTFAPLGVSTSLHSLCWCHTSSHRIAWALDDDVLAALDFVHHRELRRRPPSIAGARFAGWPVGVVIPTAHAWAYAPRARI